MGVWLILSRLESLMNGQCVQDVYRWFGNVTPEAHEEIEDAIEAYIRNGMGRCRCGPLNITVGTGRQDVYYIAEIRCKCGQSGACGEICGTIPVT